MITLRTVESSADLSAFIDLPYRLYEEVPNWVPPFKRDVRTQLDRNLNPFFEHGEAEYFLAERSGRVVGRIAAIVNHLHNETHGDRVGFFGFFECVADAEAAEALVSRAAEWLSERGMTAMRGPMSFSVNEECGATVTVPRKRSMVSTHDSGRARKVCGVMRTSGMPVCSGCSSPPMSPMSW